MADRIVAVGLLTARDLEMLGSGFRRVFPIDQGAEFQDLLHAIDEAVERVEGGGRRSAEMGRTDRA